MTNAEIERVSGYEVRVDLSYDPNGHMWVEVLDGGGVRLGLDPLGVETSGTVAAVALIEVGQELHRGDAFGSLEAEKFVGPLICPLTGRITAVNAELLSWPAALDADPFGSWLVELDPHDFAGESSELVRGPEQVRSWFAAAVKDYRLKGVLAE